MELFLIIIIIILAYLLLRKKSSNNIKEDLNKDIKVYGKAFKQAGSTFMNTLKDEKNNYEKPISPNNLFINNTLNPEYAVEPSVKDDKEFYQAIQKYNKDGELRAWGPFDFEGNGTYDSTQAYKAIPFKMYWVFIRMSKDEMKKLFDFHLSKNNVEKTQSHRDLLESKELFVYANVFLTKKNPVRWIGNIDLQFDDSIVHAGTIGSNNQSRFWENLDLFINQKIELFDDPIQAYEDVSD